MLSGDVTTGCLGFVKIGNRDWMPKSSMPSRRSHRCSHSCRRESWQRTSSAFSPSTRPDRPHNRRALIAHLDERLAPGQPGPVSALFLDLDRLKAINDYLGHTAGDWFIRVFAKRLEGGVEAPT